MINPFPRAKELYQEYCDNSMLCVVHDTWEQLSVDEQQKWVRLALKEHFGD